MNQTKELKSVNNALKLNIKKEFLLKLKEEISLVPTGIEFESTRKTLIKEIETTQYEIDCLIEVLEIDKYSYLTKKTKAELLEYYK